MVRRHSLNPSFYSRSHREVEHRRTLSRADKYILYHLWGSVCAYCGGPGPFHFDHIVPVVRGGKDELENLCLACITCNERKRTWTAEEWGYPAVAGDALFKAVTVRNAFKGIPEDLEELQRMEIALDRLYDSRLAVDCLASDELNRYEHAMGGHESTGEFQPDDPFTHKCRICGQWFIHQMYYDIGDRPELYRIKDLFRHPTGAA